MALLHVRAVPGRMLQAIDARGHAVAVGARLRYVGLDVRTRAPLPDGEKVADTTHYRRAIGRGDLELIAEVES